VSLDSKASSPVRVGVIGGGQLARMMGEEAAKCNVFLTVLAESSDDPATHTCDDVIIGSPQDIDALRALAAQSDVITFDHELLHLGLLGQVSIEGTPLLPGIDALMYAVDKAHQRRRFAHHELPLPSFLIIGDPEHAMLLPFLDSLTSEPVIKMTRGGYDGRGVFFPESREETMALILELTEEHEILLEERLSLDGEVAQVVACGVGGVHEFYPLVTTVQANGMCVETIYPCTFAQELEEEARSISQRVATITGAVGNLAIEYFVVNGKLIINEIALRPHNSGHWTIEGCETSQFANHLLAVSGQPLGPVTPRGEHVVMVNVVGSDAPGSYEDAVAVVGANVHDYGKSWRPGRKLGHVTVVGEDAQEVNMTAWKSAVLFGTPDLEAK